MTDVPADETPRALPAAPAEEDFVQTRDLRVYERRSGPPIADSAGDPVVFLHGFPQTGHQWRHQQAALGAAGYATFAPDHRGFGHTDKPLVRVSRWLLAQDVINYLDAVGIERCTLVGHDWGGIIASKVALDHPDRVARLALLDTLATVWSPLAVHGFWFKAEGLAERFFEQHHQAFIEVLFGGRDAAELGQRPENPWPIPPGPRERPAWIDDDDLAHYVDAFRDPLVWWHAISYYRYALPFHEILPTGFHSLDETTVAEMWTYADGLEQHPRFGCMSFGPEDHHKRYPGPCLWLYGAYLGGALEEGRSHVPSGDPFLDQFPHHFPDLRARSVGAGHFLGEERPGYVNECLLAFARDAI